MKRPAVHIGDTIQQCGKLETPGLRFLAASSHRGPVSMSGKPAKPQTKRKSPSKIPSFRAVGIIHSELKSRKNAPRQGAEGAPEAWLEVHDFAAPALEGLVIGDEIIVLTWLHQSRREVLKVHPRGNKQNPLTGVFSTRSPDRPNPIGLHRVSVRQIDGNRLRIGPIEAIDGTPVVDIKPVLCPGQEA